MTWVFRYVRRALRDDGTLWLNIGDTYRNKSLCGVPWMLAFSLREDGWFLRSDIIWHKPNPMPDGAKDRPTASHEYVFLMAKSDRYLFDAESIAEKAGGGWNLRGKKGNTDRNDSANTKTRQQIEEMQTETRNKRTVWTVASQPFSGSHFATMPPALAETCILAGSRVGDIVLDPFFGSGTTGMVAEKHGRKWIGFDLNPAYEKLQKERTAQRSLVLGGDK
jgi:site-specific DNA-methyltransferase (adenine-specific)